jgi:hypothetical protein
MPLADNQNVSKIFELGAPVACNSRPKAATVEQIEQLPVGGFGAVDVSEAITNVRRPMHARFGILFWGWRLRGRGRLTLIRACRGLVNIAKASTPASAMRRMLIILDLLEEELVGVRTVDGGVAGVQSPRAWKPKRL